jgi:hypothetical protein
MSEDRIEGLSSFLILDPADRPQNRSFKMKSTKKVCCFLGVLAMFASLMALPVKGFCDEGNKEVIAELQKIKSEGQPFQIKLATAEKKDTYKTGEMVSLFFTADRDCFVYLIDIGTSGKVHVLFPNKWEPVNKAEKGKIYKIPAEGSKVVFKVHAPEGTNYLKAIATLKPVESLASVNRKADDPFAELTNPTERFKDVGLELAQNKEWTEAEISIKVVK